MHSAELADRYYASVIARDIDQFMALFADDASFVLPDGRTVSGSVAIREMESGVFKSEAPTPTVKAVVANENSIAVEVEATLQDGSIHRLASLFRLNAAGKIQRLSIYRQG